MEDSLPLLAKLNEVLSSLDDLMVTLLLDGSGSVSAQWEEVRQLCLDLVQKLNGVDIQVLQFSTASRTECPFTKDKNQLIKAIQSMKIMGGSTNMSDGFKLARTSLFRSLTTTSIPVIFFVTDGMYSGDHPGKEVQALLKIEPAPTVIGIGVGSGVNVDQLRSILPGQQVFHLTDYSQLNKLIKSITVKPQQQEPAIKIEFLPSAKVQKSREDLMLQFKCEPDIALESLPAGTKMHFLPNNFFYADEVKLQHPAYKNKPVQEAVILKIKPEAKLLGEFPEKIWYEATIPGTSRGCYRGYVQMLLGWLAGDFVYDPAPTRPINFMLWGPMGSGKSSFINGITTLFSSRQDVQRPLMAFRSNTHVTKDYSCTAIADVLDDSPLGLALKDKLKINFWDPWGLTSGGYKNLSLIHFLEGRVRAGTQLNDSPCNTPVDQNNIIHAIIFMIPIGTSQDAAMLETLAKNIVTALEFRIYPKVVVNFVNTVPSEAEVKKAFDTIQNASHLPAKDVFMLDNYDSEQFRNMDKDLQYWKIMKAAFAEAVKHLGRAGVPPPPSDHPFCQNSKCVNLNKAVTTPRCPHCGEVPPLPNSLVCVSPGCKDYLKPVPTPRCGQCGEMTGTKPLPAVSICISASCANFKKPVSTPRCAFCGELPGKEVPLPAVQAQEVKTKVCLKSDCGNFSKPVPTPRCPHCGTESGYPQPSSGRVCATPGCANHGKSVDPNFPRCPFCGSPPTSPLEQFKNLSLSPQKNQVPRCQTPTCTNFKSEIPAQFACCPFCGAPSAR